MVEVPQARTVAGAAGLAALLAEPARAVVALDFDGTLAPIVDDPEQARAHPGAVPALARLARYVDSIAVVTGRPAAVAASYGGFAEAGGLSRLVVLGHYGRERWESDRREVVSPPLPAEVARGLAAVRAGLPALLADLDLPAGVAVEDKGDAVAVHTRRSADPAGALVVLREPLAALAARHGLAVEPGRYVLELRPPGMDKGAALSAYVAERAADAVLFAGDDLGDLAAYDAVEAMRERGIPGVTVCAGSAEAGEVARRADLVVDGPAGVVDLLTALADALDSE